MDSSPARQIKLDVVIRDLLPERTLRVTSVGMDEYALRVEYEITPPINPAGWEDAIKEGAAQYVWYLSGHDNLGNEYDDWGGAYGLSPDGQRTEGVRSLPLPAANASWLDLGFSSPDDEQPRYVLRVNLPIKGA